MALGLGDEARAWRVEGLIWLDQDGGELDTVYEDYSRWILHIGIMSDVEQRCTLTRKRAGKILPELESRAESSQLHGLLREIFEGIVAHLNQGPDVHLYAECG